MSRRSRAPAARATSLRLRSGEAFYPLGVRTTKSTLGPLLTGLQTCLWAVLALCVGSAFGSFTQSPLDLPQAESLFQPKPTEGQRVYFNARFYDAERGAFIGRDPKLQFWTPYSYVGNGPLSATDPTGLSTRLNDDRSYDCLDDGSDEWFKADAGGNVIQRNVQKLTDEDYIVKGSPGELSVSGLNSALELVYKQYTNVPHNLNTELGFGFKEMLWLADSPFGESSKGMNEKTHMIYGGKWFSSDEVNYLAAGIIMRWNERVDAHWMISAIADGKLRRGYPLTAGTIMWALIGYNYKAYPSSGQNVWIRPPETKHIPGFLVIKKAESNLK